MMELEKEYDGKDANVSMRVDCYFASR